jgi:hypothetical protein
LAVIRFGGGILALCGVPNLTAFTIDNRETFWWSLEQGESYHVIITNHELKVRMNRDG